MLNKQGLRAKSLLRPDDAYETLTSTCSTRHRNHNRAASPQTRAGIRSGYHLHTRAARSQRQVEAALTVLGSGAGANGGKQ